MYGKPDRGKGTRADGCKGKRNMRWRATAILAKILIESVAEVCHFTEGNVRNQGIWNKISGLVEDVGGEGKAKQIVTRAVDDVRMHLLKEMENLVRAWGEDIKLDTFVISEEQVIVGLSRAYRKAVDMRRSTWAGNIVAAYCTASKKNGWDISQRKNRRFSMWSDLKKKKSRLDPEHIKLSMYFRKCSKGITQKSNERLRVAADYDGKEIGGKGEEERPTRPVFITADVHK
jgi:hypothetical protein